MNPDEASARVRIERFHYSVRLGSLFFPIAVDELAAIADKLGYQSLREVRERMPDVPHGMRLSMTGPVAIKPSDKRSLRVDMERGVIAIQGVDIEGVIEDFEGLEKGIKDELHVDLATEARFYEFILDAEALVENGRDPVKETASFYSDSKLLARLSPIMGEQIANFGIRLTKKDQYPNSDELLDLRIEPSVSKPKTRYSIAMVFRQTTKSEVIEQAKSIEGKIQQILGVLKEVV